MTEVRSRLQALFPLLVVTLLGGCPEDTPPADDDTSAPADDDSTAADDDATTPDECDDHPGDVLCDGNIAIHCDPYGDVDHTDDCSEAAQHYCSPGYGCVLCEPGEVTCHDNDVIECFADGTGWTVLQACDEDAGWACQAGECVSLCDIETDAPSSYGCLFYAVDMDQNDVSEDAPFGVVVSNVEAGFSSAVTVEARDAGVWYPVLTSTVAPLTSELFTLPRREIDDSGINEGGAYRITTSVPVVAYQFNPIFGSGWYLTDASLLLPVEAWGTEYRIPGWMEQPEGDRPQHSSLDVVAMVDGTVVTVTPACETLSGPGVAVASPTAPVQVVLDEGDVLQLGSAAEGLSLAGSHVVTDASTPVAVFAGHECAYIPGDGYCCCDHLEEQILGMHTWGQEYLAARIPPRATTPEYAVWQFVAGNGAVTLTFDAHADVIGLPASSSLGAGEVASYLVSGTPADPGDFAVTGDAPFLLTQYMVCADVATEDAVGDPSMVQAIPAEQWLSEYVVLVPPTWEQDHLLLTRVQGTTVEVDGQDVDAWPAGSRPRPSAAAGTRPCG